MCASFAYNHTPPVACNHWTRASYVVCNESCARSRQECSHRRHKKIDLLGCHVRCFPGMEVHHACRIQNHFAKCGICTGSSLSTIDIENCEWEDLQNHIDCPSTSNKFLNVIEFIPTTGNQPTTLDCPCPLDG